MNIYLRSAAWASLATVAAVLVFSLVLADSSSISDWWLMGAMAAPVIAVYACAPSKVPDRAMRLRLSLLAGLFAALANYVTFAVMDAMWNDRSVIANLLDPTQMGEIASTRASGSAVGLSTWWFGVAFGFAGGAWLLWTFLADDEAAPGPPGSH